MNATTITRAADGSFLVAHGRVTLQSETLLDAIVLASELRKDARAAWARRVAAIVDVTDERVHTAIICRGARHMIRNARDPQALIHASDDTAPATPAAL